MSLDSARDAAVRAAIRIAREVGDLPPSPSEDWEDAKGGKYYVQGDQGDYDMRIIQAVDLGLVLGSLGVPLAPESDTARKAGQ